SHRVREGEITGETPVVLSGSVISENQPRTGVSLSRVLGSETPKTPRRPPPPIATAGMQGGPNELGCQLVPVWDEAKDGRAAIVEHDGKIPRAWGEGFARLHPDRPPGDVPVKRWLQFVDDIGLFLDSGWAEQAAGLGWGPCDLFGCDRDRPFARIDQAGLL